MGTEAPNADKDTLGTRSEVEVLEGCKRRVKASVPVERVREELDKNYRQLTQSVQIPGFRRGHVPRKLLEARYGEEIEGDVKEALLSMSFAEVLEEKNLKALGSPRFENVTFAKDADLSYEVELEVRPEFEVEGYKGIEVDWEPVTFDEDLVQKALERFQLKQSSLVGIEAAEGGPDDWYSGTYQLYRDGVLVKTPTKVNFMPSEGRVERFEVPDLPGKFAAWDRSPENPLTIGVKVPVDFPDEVLQGTDAELRFQLGETFRRSLPPIDDALAQAVGAESLDALKAAIREQMTVKSRREEEELVDGRILEKILEKTSMDLPAGLIESQKERLHLEREYKLLQAEVPADEVERILAEGESKGTDTKELEHGLKTFFILEKIAEKEKIFATEREVEDRVRTLSGLYQAPLEMVRDELRKSGRLEELRVLLRHDKVRKFLRENAKIHRKDGSASGPDSPPPAGAESAGAVPASPAGETGPEKPQGSAGDV